MVPCDRPSKLVVVGSLFVQVDHQGVGSHDLTIYLTVGLWHLSGKSE